MRRNPRISVVVTEADLEVLKRVSAATGETVSSTVGGLIHVVVPVLGRVATLAEMAARAKEEVKEGLLSNLEAVQEQLEPQVFEALRLMGVPVESVVDGDQGMRERPVVFLDEVVEARASAGARARSRRARGRASAQTPA